jgi:hypothetical protein
VILQYLLGLRRLGYEVLFLDRLPRGENQAVRVTAAVLERAGLGGRFALIDGADSVGLARRDVLARLRDSELLLNVMGFLDDEELLAAAPRRVFLDIDPGFPQMWQALGLADVLAGHDAFVTIGLRVGAPDCEVPVCGVEWVTTPQPVVLEHWPTVAGGSRFTSVASWRGDWGPVEYGGKTYGLRVHEFRQFAELPRRTRRAFELALAIHPDEVRDLALLAANGWRLVDPVAAAGDPEAYRAYVQGSRAEIMVAKGMYVEARTGWFSDRSICYLASGKPVLAQDTGLDGRLGHGEGLLLFRTLDEAIAGVEEIERDYERHSRAARALAEDVFDSDRVLVHLLGSLGVG